MKAMKLRTVGSDGRPCALQTFPFHPADPDTGEPYADVTIWLRPITRDREKAIRREHSTVEAIKGVGLRETVDEDAVFDALLDEAIVRWEGIVGADDRPLACVFASKRELPFGVRMKVLALARGADSVEVAAESFRESSDVAPLVGRLQ